MVEGSSFEKVQGLKELENVLECFERCLDEIWRDDMFSNFFITFGKLASVIYVSLRWKESIELKNREQGGKLYLVESNVKS